MFAACSLRTSADVAGEIAGDIRPAVESPRLPWQLASGVARALITACSPLQDTFRHGNTPRASRSPLPKAWAPRRGLGTCRNFPFHVPTVRKCTPDHLRMQCSCPALLYPCALAGVIMQCLLVGDALPTPRQSAGRTRAPLTLPIRRSRCQAVWWVEMIPAVGRRIAAPLALVVGKPDQVLAARQPERSRKPLMWAT
jgi:hypothetical protein